MFLISWKLYLNISKVELCLIQIGRETKKRPNCCLTCRWPAVQVLVSRGQYIAQDSGPLCRVQDTMKLCTLEWTFGLHYAQSTPFWVAYMNSEHPPAFRHLPSILLYMGDHHLFYHADFIWIARDTWNHSILNWNIHMFAYRLLVRCG